MTSWIKILLHSVGITVLSVLFVTNIHYDPANMPNFGSTQSMDITDVYNGLAQGRKVEDNDSSIVLFKLKGDESRREVAEVLKTISRCHPKVIALDILYEEWSRDDVEGDEILVETIDSIPNLIVASDYLYDEDTEKDTISGQFFLDMLPEEKYGHVVLSSSPHQVVRMFNNYKVMNNGDTLRSFTSQIARNAFPQKYKELCERDSLFEYIHFPSRDFEEFSMEGMGLKSEQAKLKDKVVFVGLLTPNEDTHPTPIDPNMSGMKIHAYALSTILTGKYIEHGNDFLQWFVSILLVFILIYARVYYMMAGNPLGDFVIRILQMLMVALCVYWGYLLFINYQIYWDISMALLTCISLLVADAWQAGIYLVNKILRKIQ